MHKYANIVSLLGYFILGCNHDPCDSDTQSYITKRPHYIHSVASTESPTVADKDYRKQTDNVIFSNSKLKKNHICFENTPRRSPTIHIWCRMYYFFKPKKRENISDMI